MRLMEKMSTFLIACLFIMVALNVNATAGVSGNFTYSEEDGKITIDNYTGKGRDVSIPAEINGKAVTTIGYSAFLGCTSLTKITIPNSVTSIRGNAFNGCTGLADIIVSENNINYTSIDGILFSKNKSILIKFPSGKKLNEYTIPASVKTIEYTAFSGCISLTKITIPTSVTTIGDNAFNGCTGLTGISLPDSVTTIGDLAFSSCTGLTDIIVSENNVKYTSIDGILFSKNKSILIKFPLGKKSNEYTIPDSVTTIGDAAFSDCAGLTKIFIPNSVTTIGDSAFSSCTGLTDITIPNSITTIGKWAFYNCLGLSNIIIPRSVTTIGDSAFSGCTSLANITISENNVNYTSIDGILFSKNKSILIKFPLGKKSNEYTIPDSVTTIGNSAFSGCTGLINIIIPKSVTIIGAYSFSGCTGLTKIILPDGVTTIGHHAFSGCTGFTVINIPDSVKTIGNSVFYGCTGLTKIIIPNSVTAIEFHTFLGCTNLTNITIPVTVTSIDKDAFIDCTKLTIYGSQGSIAEKYAKENGIPFKEKK